MTAGQLRGIGVNYAGCEVVFTTPDGKTILEYVGHDVSTPYSGEGEERKQSGPPTLYMRLRLVPLPDERSGQEEPAGATGGPAINPVQRVAGKYNKGSGV